MAGNLREPFRILLLTLALSYTAAQTLTLEQCTGAYFELEAACPYGESIQVLSAVAGSSSQTTGCASASSDCVATVTTQELMVIQDSCDGKIFCDSFLAETSNTVACGGNLNYIQIEYECVVTDTQNLYTVACVGEEVTMGCPVDYHLLFAHVVYGDLNGATCAGHSSDEVTCAYDAADVDFTFYEQLLTACEFNQSCAGFSGSSVATPDCGDGTADVLLVGYTCQPDNLVIQRCTERGNSENFDDLDCGADRTVNIVQAFYGSEPGVLTAQQCHDNLHTNSCLIPLGSLFQEFNNMIIVFCQDKQMCDVGLFPQSGDPEFTTGLCEDGIIPDFVRIYYNCISVLTTTTTSTTTTPVPTTTAAATTTAAITTPSISTTTGPTTPSTTTPEPPTTEPYTGPTEEPDEPNKNLGVIIGVVASVVPFLILLTAVCCICCRRRGWFVHIRNRPVHVVDEVKYDPTSGSVYDPYKLAHQNYSGYYAQY